jgi:PAS domain S-box-containing protein
VPFSREDLLEYTTELLDGNRPRTRSDVLVVEQDPEVASMAERAFEAHGFSVRTASTALEAEHRWAEKRADVVLLDCDLPGTTWEALLGSFSTPSERAVLVAVTGDADPSLPVTLIRNGADACVRKPFDPLFVVELTRKAQRERSLLRVEVLLEQRTQELRASERRYRSLFEAIPDLVLALDESDRVLQVNDEVARSLGRDADSLRGMHLLELVPQEMIGRTTAALDRIRRSGNASFEASLLGRDGKIMTVEFTGVATEHSGQSAALLVGRDLTWRRQAEDERRQLEHQMQHAQRLESIGVLAGGIAHDFNNLLVGILGNASLALLEAERGEVDPESLRQIEIAAKRAAELTQQILTFSGKGKPVMRPVDLTALVSEMGTLLEPAVSKKARLTYRLHGSVGPVEGDASQIRQVVMNLIMNASDALGNDSGTITVETREQLVEADHLQSYYLGEAASPGRYVCLEVTDDGCGMDAETRRQIFDPFFTTKFTGRGIGLAATLGIVRAHHGLISVESEPDRGTRFQMLLPALPVEGRIDDDRDRPDTLPWTRGGSVLVVDDERTVRHLARSALQRRGFAVVLATDGEEALLTLAQNPRIALVVLDLTMPRLDGLQVLERIRAEHPDLPVILSSGYTAEGIPAGALGGLTGFLAKPYMPDELVQAVAGLLHSRESKGPGDALGSP